jgi:very-short-patch-repair endonuclease
MQLAAPAGRRRELGAELHVERACGGRSAEKPRVGQGSGMHPVEALKRLGGVGERHTLLRITSRRRLRTAERKGQVLRVGHGRYALPTAHEGLRAAARLSGVASHLTAASIHGWELAEQPVRPQVIVPRNRHVDPARRDDVELRWRDLDPDDVVRSVVTDPYRTVIDCARDLPFPQALAVADSALRHGLDPDRLREMALRVRTTGRQKALRVVEAMDARAANPFESVLRAIALDVPGLDLEPQAVIRDRGFLGRPDLVDRSRRIVLEADSFAFHGTRRALKKDCERYNALVIRGWTVIRLSWEHVMLEPDYVRALLMVLAGGPAEHAALTQSLLHTA